jgi:hypothetical protein
MFATRRALSMMQSQSESKRISAAGPHPLPYHALGGGGGCSSSSSSVSPSHPSLMYSLTLLQSFAESRQSDRDLHDITRRIRTRLEVSTDPMRQYRVSGGDQRLANIRRMLNCFGLVRSPDQQHFHTWFLRACLPLIYGSDYQSHHMRIMEENNITDIDSEVLIVTPRRFGKTTAVALFVTAMLLCVPGIKIAIFSTGKRASTGLTDLVRTFLKFIPGASERICERNQEKLSIAATPLPPGQGLMSQAAKEMAVDPSTSRLLSFPVSLCFFLSPSR